MHAEMRQNPTPHNLPSPSLRRTAGCCRKNCCHTHSSGPHPSKIWLGIVYRDDPCYELPPPRPSPKILSIQRKSARQCTQEPTASTTTKALQKSTGNKKTATHEVRFSQPREPRSPPVVKICFRPLKRVPHKQSRKARVRFAWPFPAACRYPATSLSAMYWRSPGSLSPPVFDRASTCISADAITSRCCFPHVRTLPWPHFSKNERAGRKAVFPSKP